MLIAHGTRGKKGVEEAVSSEWADEKRPRSNLSSTMGGVQGGVGGTGCESSSPFPTVSSRVDLLGEVREALLLWQQIGANC